MGGEADVNKSPREALWVPNLGKWMKEEDKSISSLNQVKKLGIVRYL